MDRVSRYKCIFETSGERFKCVLTLANGGGKPDFVVSNPDAAETLLDMFEDSSEVHFDAASGELTFAFGDLALEEEERPEDEEDEEDETAGETKERASNRV